MKFPLASLVWLWYYNKVAWSDREQQNPGVAKFGIALEWGSRGRWFESSHSDQESSETAKVSGLSFFMPEGPPTRIGYYGVLEELYRIKLAAEK